jgi:rubrerythrin
MKQKPHADQQLRVLERPACASVPRHSRAASIDAAAFSREKEMVTTVGTESTLNDLVENLLILEHDAIAAYDQTIARLENPEYKRTVASFKADHDRHVQELTQLASAIGATPYTEGDAKQMLTTGKVAMASMMGDGAILAAMRTNEEDTVTAYERASRHAEATPEARTLFERAHSDELRHREWMSNAANA